MRQVAWEFLLKFLVGVVIPATIWFTLIKSDTSASAKEIASLKFEVKEIKEKIYEELTRIREDVSEIKGELKYDRRTNP